MRFWWRSASFSFYIIFNIFVNYVIIISIGNFSFNEVITGGTSGTTARVRKWNEPTNELEVSAVEGSGFIKGESITGGSSGAVHSIRLIDLTNFYDGYGDNDEFETAAEDILDFTEGNPFGQP